MSAAAWHAIGDATPSSRKVPSLSPFACFVVHPRSPSAKSVQSAVNSVFRFQVSGLRFQPFSFGAQRLCVSPIPSDPFNRGFHGWTRIDKLVFRSSLF